MTAAFPKRAPRTWRVTAALGARPLLGVWLHAGWVSEDAHIPLRALENLTGADELR